MVQILSSLTGSRFAAILIHYRRRRTHGKRYEAYTPSSICSSLQYTRAIPQKDEQAD
ncbi:hypothetical protein BGZ63DRAFT_251111 [Mariannaea sp. PMI_226]|nr:hypothetical protein BGZ63DRAFT_251111 [Mariannaea sp. PMI_226]